jgi:acetyl esterase/lipase
MISGAWRRWRSLRPSTRRAVWATVGVANARWPRRYNRVLQTPSFFWGWLDTELAFPILAVHSWRAWRSRNLTDAQGVLAASLNVVSAVGLASFIAEGVATDDQFSAALAPHLSAEDIAARPPSVRAGAWLPLLYGGRGRRVRTRDVVFTPEGSPHRRRLDVYEPIEPWDGVTRRPAIVQIHGGGWVIGDKREQGIPLLNHLAANGWVGFNVNYSLAPRSRAPQQLIDCKLALAYIKAHADEYGIDPDFVCVTGGSAGGHLAALMALTANDPAFQPGFTEADTSVAAAVPFYGVYDLVDDEHLMIRGFRQMLVEPLLFDTKFTEDEISHRAYSPHSRIGADAPPMMVVHGSRDTLVPVEVARRFVGELARVSTSPVVYTELYGANHAFELFPSPRTVRTIEYVERFLDGVYRGVIK